MSVLPEFVRRWLHASRTRRDAAAMKREHVGPRSFIAPTVHVLGWKNVRIGHHTTISDETWLNVNHRDLDEASIVIGDNCFIGRRNFLTSGARIVVGDYCLTGVDCHFLGSDHLHGSPFVPYMTTGTTADGVIEIGPNCWLGSSVTVLKNVKIGYGSIIGAAAVVTRNIPPLSIAVGNPARVIRRFDTRRSAWVEASDYPPEGDQDLPSEANYLAGLRRTHPAIKGPRAASSHTAGDI